MNSLNASSVSVQDAQSDLISRVTHYHKQTKHHFNRYASPLGCKLPCQRDTGKGELLVSSWARYVAGGKPAKAS